MGSAARRRVRVRRSGRANRATALFNAANVLRDRGDVAEARAALEAGLEATAGAARRALVAPANHHPSEGAAAAARLRGPEMIAANSLVVLDDFLAADPGAARAEIERLAGDRPWGGPERAPALEELAPLGVAPAPLHLVVQVYEPADPRRRAELAFAFMRNLANPRIGHVHCLLERPRDADFVVAAARALGKRRRPDLTVRNGTGRLTFAAAFASADRSRKRVFEAASLAQRLRPIL